MNKKRKTNEYFAAFEQLVEYSCQGATFLQKTLKEFKPEHLPRLMAEMHEIEHAADVAKHEMMTKLAKEFVTPIEREDIIQMANDLDEVTDLIEDVLMRIYMYNIVEILPEAMRFTDVIVRCCEALRDAMAEFYNFRKSHTLHDYVVKVNTMEEEGDDLYIDAMRELYCSAKDPILVLAWSETFDHLEKCCDACEHVANQIESVVMKNA